MSGAALAYIKIRRRCVTVLLACGNKTQALGAGNRLSSLFAAFSLRTSS